MNRENTQSLKTQHSFYTVLQNSGSFTGFSCIFITFDLCCVAPGIDTSIETHKSGHYSSSLYEHGCVELNYIVCSTETAQLLLFYCLPVHMPAPLSGCKTSQPFVVYTICLC